MPVALRPSRDDDPRPPLYIGWNGAQVRIRHDDPRLTPHSPGVTRLRSAVELASDVEGLRLMLGVGRFGALAEDLKPRH